MEKQLFPWTPNQDPAESAATPPTTNGESTRPWLRQIKKFAPFGLFALVLAALFFTKGPSGGSAAAAPSQVDVLVLMTPLSKGTAVWPEILKEVPVRRDVFSKPQLLQLLRAGDLQNLRGRLRAKHTLAPNKPLLWSDLDFVSPPSGFSEVPQTFIVYPKEN